MLVPLLALGQVLGLALASTSCFTSAAKEGLRDMMEALMGVIGLPG